jgi:hypothetical protein
MRYLRTHGPSLFKALEPIASSLDACWWYLGGRGFQETPEFAERHGVERYSDACQEILLQLLTDYVENDTPVDRVGKPGFFTRLADAVDFQWACYFAIESQQLPLATLEMVQPREMTWFAPIDGLPRDVVLLARDIDSGYQEYGFRDDWMFTAVLEHLRRLPSPVEEVTEWPHASA